MKIKTEKDLEAYLVSECEARGWDAIKFTSPGRRGVPDRIISADFNTIVFCEVKHPNGKGVLSANQEDEIAGLQDRHHIVYVVETVDQIKRMIYDIRVAVQANKYIYNKYGG